MDTMILVLLIVLMLAALIITHVFYNKKLDEIKKRNKTIQKQVYDLILERDSYKDRTEELEDKIEYDFGTSVRNVTNVVKIEFTKVELVAMMTGIFKLLSSPKTIDDVKYYLALYDKIQGVVDKMTEDQEGN
jgi:hypothetical protein